MVAEATPEWRAALGFSSWVDAVKVDPMEGTRSWSHAQIVEETDRQVRLDFELAAEYYSRWVDRASADLAPMNTKTCTLDFEWFSSLKVGQRVDCCDPFDKWYVRRRPQNNAELAVADSGGWARGSGTTPPSSRRAIPPTGRR